MWNGSQVAKESLLTAAAMVSWLIVVVILAGMVGVGFGCNTQRHHVSRGVQHIHLLGESSTFALGGVHRVSLLATATTSIPATCYTSRPLTNIFLYVQ